MVFVVTANGSEWDSRILKQVRLKLRWENSSQRFNYLVRPSVDWSHEIIDILRVVIDALFFPALIVSLHS